MSRNIVEEDVGWEMGSGGGAVQRSTASMLQPAVSEASHRHSQTLPPGPPQKTEKKPQKTKNVNNNKQRGSIDGRRMHRVTLPMGHGMCADHARLTLTLAAQYGGW